MEDFISFKNEINYKAFDMKPKYYAHRRRLLTTLYILMPQLLRDDL